MQNSIQILLNLPNLALHFPRQTGIIGKIHVTNRQKMKLKDDQ